MPSFKWARLSTVDNDKTPANDQYGGRPPFIIKPRFHRNGLSGLVRGF
jgi:hypothetical protein